jgi:hypothetical protein
MGWEVGDCINLATTEEIRAVLSSINSKTGIASGERLLSMMLVNRLISQLKFTFQSIRTAINFPIT